MKKNKKMSQIKTKSDIDLNQASNTGLFRSIVISTNFNIKSKLDTHLEKLELNSNSKKLIDQTINKLEVGGLLFIYGQPKKLSIWSNYILNFKNESKMIFKYWIALNIDKLEDTSCFNHSHQGLVMFLKSKSNTKNQPPFFLNTKEERIPHKYCISCKDNIKDWGGKKHLMNPKGTCISDVWSDLKKRKINDYIIPDDILNRISNLTLKKEDFLLHIIQTKTAFVTNNKIKEPNFSIKPKGMSKLRKIEKNKVYYGDSVELLKKVSKLHPGGLFDLVFADPPYNLSKNYNQYDDTISDKDYIEWCNLWLWWMYKSLKPGGALYVLNLPKWSIFHAEFLRQYMEFQNWIVWDALSEPRGKMMPAHYSLLYFTKKSGKKKFNYSYMGGSKTKFNVVSPDSPEYCLRAKCVKSRKQIGDNNKIPLSDIWSNLHRIKHKRDRDSHPCQLPDSLMERIIKLSSNPGDIVFDPFGGAGTTAIVSHLLDRNFVICDIDKEYVEISTKKIERINNHVDLFGEKILTKNSVRRPKKGYSKKEVELYLQSLAKKLNRAPTINDIKSDNHDMIVKIDSLYPTRKSAIRKSKVALV